MSVNWETSGGGSFAVIPLEVRGKLPEQIPLFRGHTASVLDTDWNPFDDHIIASSSDDGKIAIWRIPDDYKVIYEDPEEIKDIAPLKKLSGHSRKVGHIQWHPTAENILASSSADYTVKIWNVETEKVLYTLPHKDLVTSFAFNFDGSLLATVSRDKKIRIWDIRAEKVVNEGPSHGGAKSSRIVWLGAQDRLVTTGFSKLSDRQFALWDSTDIAKGPIGGFYYLDGSSGICVPFFDDNTNCLYLAGKGDGNIRYFEYENDEFFPLSEYQSSDPQRGIAFLPKRAINLHEHEVVRIYKSVRDLTIEPISFIVPRRAETFQDDIYPPAYAGKPSLTADEWISGKNSPPKVFSLEAIFDGTTPETVTASVPKKEVVTPKESKPEPKPSPVAKKEAPTPAPIPEEPEKKDLDGLLNDSKHVNNLLAKASTSEEPLPEPLKDEESSWDNEPEVKIQKPSPKKETTVEALSPAIKESDEPIKENNKNVSTPVVKEATKEVEEVKDTPKTIKEIKEPATTTSSPAAESIAGGSPVLKLLKLVVGLDAKVQTLIDDLKVRDARILELENKIYEILNKNE